MSLSHYAPIVIFYPRLTLIFAPPMALLIAFGLTELLEPKKGTGRILRTCSYLLFALIICFLTLQSIYLISNIQWSWYDEMYRNVAVGNYINSLPRNTTVFLDDSMAYVAEYTDHLHKIYCISAADTTCSYLTSGNYVVKLSNQTFQGGICDLNLAFQPAVPYWLSSYTLYSVAGWNRANMTVYEVP